MKIYYIAATFALLLVGSVTAIGHSIGQISAHKEPGFPVSIEKVSIPGNSDDGPDTPSREASGGHGGCSVYEDVVVNGMITPKCVSREYTNDDRFWMLHPWFAS